jgi:hypothetical protein
MDLNLNTERYMKDFAIQKMRSEREEDGRKN